MSPTYDNHEAPRSNRDPLDAAAENTLALISQAAAQANQNISAAYASAQKLAANLDAAKARIQELESVRHYYQERSERAEDWLSQISSEIEARFISRRDTQNQPSR